MKMISKSKKRRSLSCQNSCQIDWLYKNQWRAFSSILPLTLTFYPVCLISLLVSIISRPESPLFGLTNVIKMNKRKWLHAFFISNARLKLEKKRANAKQQTHWGWAFAIWKLSTLIIHLITQNNRQYFKR